MRIISNLQFVTMLTVTGSVRINATALVLDNALGFRDEVLPRIRGLHCGSTMNSFDLRLGCAYSDYELLPLQSTSVFIGSDGTERPLTSGYRMLYTDGTALQLIVEDQEQPLDQLDVPDDDYRQLWTLVDDKSLEYWKAPNYFVAVPVQKERAGDAIERVRMMVG